MEENREEVVVERESIKKKLSKIKLEQVFKGDVYIWFMVLVLMLLSLLFIFSSTASLVYKYHPDNPGYFVLRRFAHLMVGAVVIFVVYMYDSKKYYKYAEKIFFVCIGLLAATYVVGTSVNGAVRSIGPFQPSDFAKIAMIIMLAKVLTKYRDILPEVTFLPIGTWISMNKRNLLPKAQKKQDRKNHRVMYIWRNYSWRFLLPIAIMFALIVPANLSTALVVAMMGIAVLLMGGIRFKEVFKLGAIIGAIGYISLFILAKSGLMPRAATWISRISTFFSGDDSFQSHHAKVAIARGWLPRGPGSSVQRASLPRAESDFMFAYIVEEYSLLIATVIILLYIWLFQRAIKIVRRYDNRFESLLCLGLGFFLCFQALVHCMVNVGIAPVTGLVLPFLSNGGSGLVSMSIAVAIMLNISKHQRWAEKKLNSEKNGTEGDSSTEKI